MQIHIKQLPFLTIPCQNFCLSSMIKKESIIYSLPRDRFLNLVVILKWQRLKQPFNSKFCLVLCPAQKYLLYCKNQINQPNKSTYPQHGLVWIRHLPLDQSGRGEELDHIHGTRSQRVMMLFRQGELIAFQAVTLLVIYYVSLSTPNLYLQLLLH